MTAVTPAAPAYSRFAGAERAVLERFAVTAEERYLDLAEPRLRVRVLESGHLPWLDEPERCAALASDFLSAGGSR